MRIIADLQIHSKYSRACSQELNPKNIGLWADKKGIAVMGTGDFTHPKWLNELKENLEEAKPGLYKLRVGSGIAWPSSDKGRPLAGPTRAPRALFMCTAEVSSIYKQGDKVRRVHNLIFAPNFEAVDKIIAGLEKTGANLKSDGRPIMGVHCDTLVKIVKDADAQAEVIPAHAWTPHFGVFGSLSGFNSIKEAFSDQAKYIKAIETGLSSDPKMNWQISELDKYSLTSNSDAHSLRKIGREANVFEIAEDKLSYEEIIGALYSKDPKRFLFTIEFFPEEGKYHLDGHRDCKFSCLPAQTKKLKGICPVCGKKLLVGVLNRVDELADRDFGLTPPRSIPFKSVIPLEEIIAETLDVGSSSKKVLALYDQMVGHRPEFEILLDLDENQISTIGTADVAKGIIRVRQGQVHMDAGYDGLFGKIHIFEEGEREQILKKPKQTSLF
ncbi:MAG: endonuclease Q family protein [Candidatus Doudnabacteria bacterium]|nr:endonuclease Q family protein [Candidatus Doudnabacteria bacterium]